MEEDFEEWGEARKGGRSAAFSASQTPLPKMHPNPAWCREPGVPARPAGGGGAGLPLLPAVEDLPGRPDTPLRPHHRHHGVPGGGRWGPRVSWAFTISTAQDSPHTTQQPNPPIPPRSPPQVEAHQEDNAMLSYWLSNTVTLLYLLQRNIKPASGGSYTQRLRSQSQSVTRCVCRGLGVACEGGLRRWYT